MVLALTSQTFKQEKEKKMRTAILDALEARYEAQILEADATLKNLLGKFCRYWRTSTTYR